MIGFLVKKAFFDAWDHVATLVLLNLGCIGFLSLTAFAFFASGGSSIPLLALSGILLLVFFAWTGAQAYLLTTVADNRSPRFSDVPAAFKSGLLPGLQYGISITLMIGLASFALPFYLSLRSFIGIFAASLVFWFFLTAMLALQFFLPVRTMLKGGYFKAVKKCFLISFDNPGFSVFVLFWSFVMGIASCFLAFIVPGIAGIQLAGIEALRLRMYKYDWLEDNPAADRKHIPWADLLEEDVETIGKRTLKSLLFPWKD